MKSDLILLTYGSGVALYHPSGDVVPLATSKQVIGFLERGAIVMDDLTDEQLRVILGPAVQEAMSSGPDLSHLLDHTGAGCPGGTD